MVVPADLLQHGWPLWAAVSGTLAAGLGIGLLGAASVLILNIPSFIVTFAFMGIAYAAALVISGGDRISLPASSALPKLATGEIFGVPYQIVLALALLAVGTLGLRHLTIGRRLYAVGGNPEAARLSGLSIPRDGLPSPSAFPGCSPRSPPSSTPRALSAGIRLALAT